MVSAALSRLTLAERRRVWLDLITVAAGVRADWPESRINDLRHELVRASRVAFPTEGVSAANASRALAELGLAFAYALPERREPIAAALKATARCLEELLLAPGWERGRALLARQFPGDN